MPISKKEALEYHMKGRPGKIEVVPTKTVATQRDLALAYSPGVADPCLEIHSNPDDVFKYTARGNLVAVITNGRGRAFFLRSAPGSMFSTLKSQPKTQMK